MAWKLAGESTFKKNDRDVNAYRLVGDVSTLTVPLAWPISKDLELNLASVSADQIMILWQALVAQSETPDGTGYVPFPVSADDWADVYARPDGEPVDPLPWADRPASEHPTNWAQLIRYWYREQEWYDQRAFVEAFIEALEAHSNLPLGRRVLLLRLWLQTADTGGDVSESKPASTSTRKKTGRRSGPRSTTSSPAA